MRFLLNVAALLLTASTASAIHSSPPSSMLVADHSVFGVPRGGGWFGKNNNNRNRRRSKRNKTNENDNGGSNGDGGGGGGKMYPALSTEEITEVLNVPIYAITDQKGNGAVLSTNDGREGGEPTNVVYFFLSQKMAETALASMHAANKGMNLKISALHLGKVWFKILHNDTIKKGQVDLTPADPNLPNVKRQVSMRLVPEIRDLIGARLLSGLDPNDVPRLQEAIESDDQGVAREIIRKASENSGEFSEPFNKIPLFMVNQLRMQKKDPSGGDGYAPGSVQKFPIFFSPKTMLKVYTMFIKNAPGGDNLEPTLQLAELHKIVEMMQHESQMDFRNIVLVPGGQDDDEDNASGFDDSDDDDDDGGGDGGIERADSDIDEEGSIGDFANIEMTPYIEMGVYETTGDMPNLVPLQ